jgi:preprotein translocase subunit SecE
MLIGKSGNNPTNQQICRDSKENRFDDREKFMKKILSYFKDSFEELKKVVWPTRKQTIEITIVVIVITVIIGVYLGAADYVLNEAFNFLLEM